MSSMSIVTVDSTTGVFTVELNSGSVSRTVEFDDSHLVDLSDDGLVLGIEVLTPDDPKIEQMAERYGFRDRVPEILAAVASAHEPPARLR
jgi:uncharacterized protein YuzE